MKIDNFNSISTFLKKDPEYFYDVQVLRRVKDSEIKNMV